MKSKHFQLKLIDSVKNVFIVTAVFPDYEWKDGKPTDHLKGYKLRTVCPSAQFDETVIKMECFEAPLDPERVSANPVTVSFENLTFTSYRNPSTGRQEFIGKASGLKILRESA